MVELAQNMPSTWCPAKVLLNSHPHWAEFVWNWEWRCRWSDVSKHPTAITLNITWKQQLTGVIVYAYWTPIYSEPSGTSMSRATRSRCKKLVADSSDDIVRERRVSPHNIPYTMTDPPNAFNRGDSPNRRVLPSAPTNYPVDCPAGSPCNPPTADQPGIQDQVVNGNEMSQVLHILEMLRAENKTTSSELSGLRQENAETRKDLVEIKQQLSRTTDSIEQFTIECNRRIEGLESDIGTNKQSIKRNEEATGINKREISQLGENMVLLEEKVERQQTVIDEQKRMLKEVLNELQGIQKEKRRKCLQQTRQKRYFG